MDIDKRRMEAPDKKRLKAATEENKKYIKPKSLIVTPLIISAPLEKKILSQSLLFAEQIRLVRFEWKPRLSFMLKKLNANPKRLTKQYMELIAEKFLIE